MHDMDRWCYRGSMDSKESRDERISNTYHVCLSQTPECTDVIVIKLYVLITLLGLKHPDECLNTKANCITNNHRLFLVWAYLDCRFSSSKRKRVKNKINQLTLFLTPWMQGICNQDKDNTFLPVPSGESLRNLWISSDLLKPIDYSVYNPKTKPK